MKKILAMLVLMWLGLNSCSSAGTQAAGPAAGVLLEIVKADGSVFPFTIDQLNELPLAQVSVDGRVEEGPKLIDVLAVAGVEEFTEVALAGSSTPVTLRRAQVDDNTILDLTNRGTLKLATTYIPKPDWTRDITTITVK